MSDPKAPKFTPEFESAARTLFEHCNSDCDNKRKFMLPNWKRAEYYWNDVQDLFFREDLWDWRTFDEEMGETELNAFRDSNNNINVYRAYGESIIAAATTGNLTFRFYPANADEPLDLDKSVSFSNKADYIQRVNKIKELRRQAFVIRWNQGTVASYTFFEKDAKRFGSYQRETYGEKKALVKTSTCANPDCSYEAPTQRLETPQDFAAEVEPQPTAPGELPPIIPEPQQPLCPECNGPLDQDETIESTPYVTGVEEVSRGCSTIKLYAPLEFKIPFYARKPSDINYVIVESEVHYATARKLFPDFADRINPGKGDPTEVEKRNQADYYGSDPSRNRVTISQLWCKPDMYEIFDETDPITPKQLNKDYPDGVHKIKVNDTLVHCANVSMDEHWTFVESALDTHVYVRSLGNGVIPIQDMENDLVYFTMDTIRHGPGETYFDSRVLNAKIYKDQVAKPGNKYPVNNTLGNRPIGEYFHDVPGATLSQQVDRFHERLESRGQLVSGAFPSIYGGQFAEGSKTLGVYEQSRASALQRTTIPADGIDDFLSATIYKATVLLDKNMEDDEVYSVEDGAGFRNVELTKSPPGGKIARVEIVKSEQFPTTWEQKRAFIMELFEKNLDPINATIFAPDNISLMGRIIGIPELKVPGDADRNKQLHIIQKLLKEAVIMPELPPGADPSQMSPEMQQQFMAAIKPSIEPEPEVDNSQICYDITRAWAVSREGINAKQNNPEGYENVIMNLRAHKMIVDMQMMQQVGPVQGEEANNNPPPNEKGGQGNG